MIWGKSCDDFAKGGQPSGKLRGKINTGSLNFQSQSISGVITEVALKMVVKLLVLK